MAGFKPTVELTSRAKCHTSFVSIFFSFILFVLTSHFRAMSLWINVNIVVVTICFIMYMLVANLYQCIFCDMKIFPTIILLVFGRLWGWGSTILTQVCAWHWNSSGISSCSYFSAFNGIYRFMIYINFSLFYNI